MRINDFWPTIFQWVGSSSAHEKERKIETKYEELLESKVPYHAIFLKVMPTK